MENKDVETIDLDEIEDGIEESEWYPNGIHKETGEYNANFDAWYPDFYILSETEKELIEKGIFKEKNYDN
jgi:hypothetical protein